jgi:putative DNA primase/helicase
MTGLPARGRRRFAHTDLGNAERLIAWHGRDLRYSRGMGWQVWDDRRWTADETDEVMRRMKATVRAVYSEAGRLADSEEREKLARWARQSESERRLRAAIALADSESQVRVGAEAFDSHPFLLNVRNGTLDLRTRELRAHRREDLLTQLAPTEFDPRRNAPALGRVRRPNDGRRRGSRRLPASCGWLLPFWGCV